MMSLPPNNGKIVLITGINGYIASAIGLEMLKKGYTLRGTSRSSHGADALLNGAYNMYKDRVQLVTILDMTVPGAFDEAVKGRDLAPIHYMHMLTSLLAIDTTAIIHTASPINFSFTTWDQFVPIAVAGAIGILTSAYKHAGPQLESFIITSSVAAIVDLTKRKYAFSEKDWNTYSYDRAKELGDEAPSAMLYQASKVAAERAVWEFKEKHNVRRNSSSTPPWHVAAILLQHS